MYKFNEIVKKLIYLTFFFFLCANVSAATMHAVLFSATEDSSIGAGNRVSYDLIRAELNRINQIDNELEVAFYDFTGSDFQIDNLYKIKNQLKKENGNLENDILVFIFIGHGFNPMAEILEYPNLVFLNTTGAESETDIQENSLNLKKIIQDFKSALNPGLFIAYAEACNNNYLNGESPLTAIPSPNVINTASLSVDPSKNLRELFLEPKGLVVFASSKPSQASYVSSTEGGVYSQAFVHALQLETSASNNRKASFQSLFNNSKRFVRQIDSNYDWSQSPLYTENLKNTNSSPQQTFNDKPKKKKRGLIAWLIAKLAPNKLKKKMRKAFSEDKDLLSLNMAIPVDEPGDRMRKKMYVKHPVMYFTQEALVAEANKNYPEALKNYSIASKLWEDGYFTTEDEKLMKKMKKMDTNNLTGIQDFSNYPQWLKSKLGFYEGQFNDEVAVVDTEIENYQDRIKEIEEGIQADRAEITALKEESDQIKEEINSIDIFREQTVEVELKDMRKVSTNTLAEIRQVIAEGKTISDTAPSNEKEVLIDDSNAKVNFKFGKRRMNSNLRPDIKGYKLGKHCTEEITEFTYGLMDILLNKVEDVPDENLKDIGVKLYLTGNADWVGGDKQLGIRYTAEQKIDEQYKTKDGSTRDFYIEAGQTRNINNEDLAFLRAYCAYQTILDILKAKGVQGNIEVYFTALTWPKPPNVKANDRNAGKAYRGVDISITIENLYKHYIDKIKELEDRLVDIKEEIAQKETSIEEKKKQVTDLEDRIASAKEERQKLENIINNSKTGSNANSDASGNVDNVKSAW